MQINEAYATSKPSKMKNRALINVVIQLEEEKRELKEKIKLKDRIINQISKELNGPLYKIIVNKIRLWFWGPKKEMLK
tara:strand:- start:316 stop:549 length:234 start_codon:yes stop_codon:yes gene_type:complete